MLAAQYPPGPHGCCPDTLTIINVQNPLATPHPTTGDVVLGVGGVITAFADQYRPYGFYMQMRNGFAYSGVGVFTGNVNQGPGTPYNLQLGDSVVVYGKVKSFDGAVVIGSFGGEDDLLAGLGVDNVENSQPLIVRVVSHGNPLPPFHVGSLAELRESVPNPAARPWDGMLVRVNAPLEVVGLLEERDIDSDIATSADENHFNRGFLVVDPGCPGPVCDTVMVDCSTLTSFTPPPVGTVLSFVEGCLDQRDDRHRIMMRGPTDIGLGTPPVALDAFPTYDNDLTGASRLDSVVVVFDRPVEKTSAENTTHYSLASLGTIDGARRLDAPDDDRVVLQVHNGLNDGDHESITVKDVASLADGTPMAAPKTLGFLNGVLELEKIQAPDPGALAGSPCEDRSRFSGPGSDPGPRASLVGTVTGAFGDFYTLQGTTPARGGLWAHATGFALTPGHAYLLAGALAEVGGETQATNIVYARDLGSAAVPVPLVESVHLLLDDTCDFAQLFLNGQDLDGMLVTLNRVVVTGSQPPGHSFFVATPSATALAAAARLHGASLNAGPPEQIEIAALGGNFSFASDSGRIVTITGVLGRDGGAFAVFPRGDTDLVDFGPVPTFSQPLDVSKAATASRDPDIVLGANGQLFMAWGRIFNESVHSLSQDNTLNWSHAAPIMHQGVQPALAVTPSNKFCVLASSTDSLFFKQSTDGGFQMDPLVVTVDASPTRCPALAVGSGEHLHAAWERPGSGIFYARSLTGGADFSIPIRIALDSLPSETNSMARICASKGDSVYLFWQYHLPGDPAVDKVLYSRSLNGGASFSAPRLVRDERNPLTSVVKLAFLGDAQVGPDGTVYVMGLQAGGPNDSVAFLRSTNGGTTFALVGHPTAPALTGICPKSFAVGPDGTIHALVGVCGTALYYTTSTDGGATWGPAVDVSSASSTLVGEPRGAKIILDAKGKPVIVWFAPVGGSTEIYSARLLN
ncbi:MAG: hypothetical protein ACHQ52_08675 [Candidatus Eisenbacteria bacterium]